MDKEDVKYTQCPYCNNEIRDTPRSIGSHIGYWHKGISKDVYRKGRTYRLECKECNQKVANSNNVLARHVRSVHGIEWPLYLITHERGGVWPVCECGCGEGLEWRKGGFPRFIKGHENRGENNPMHRTKRDELSVPSFDAAVSNHEHDKSIEALDEPVTMPLLSHVGHESIGKDYIPQYIPHPLDPKKDVYVDSSDEQRFLEEKSAESVFVTKSHEIRIDYTDENGNPAIYIPDFLSVGESTVYEIDETDIRKLEAATEWCKREGLAFRVVRYVGGRRTIRPYTRPTARSIKNTASMKMS